jgi:hypothetical protein
MSSYDLNEHPNADAGFRNFADAIGYVPPAMSVDTLRQERLATMARAYRDDDGEEGRARMAGEPTRAAGAVGRAVLDQPGMTPAERDRMWRELMRQFRDLRRRAEAMDAKLRERRERR